MANRELIVKRKRPRLIEPRTFVEQPSPENRSSMSLRCFRVDANSSDGLAGGHDGGY